MHRTMCCEPRRCILLTFCASSTNGSLLLVPKLRHRTIKTCWTAVTLDSRAVAVLNYPLITQSEQPGPQTTTKTMTDDTVRDQNLATQPEKQITQRHSQKQNLPQPTWRVGSTLWAGGYLHQKLAIDGVSPQIDFLQHQILLYHHPKSHNSGLETQNRLEAISHQKLATDGASPKMVPTHPV